MVLLYTPLFSQTSTPEISLKIIRLEKTSGDKYNLQFSAEYNGSDPALFKDNLINIPRETQIIEGIALQSRIDEKDFLYSETMLDLNKNNSYDDVYTVKTKKRDIFIDNVNIHPLFVKAGKRIIFTPLKEGNTLNINKITQSGRPFTLHSYNRETGEIKMGFGPDNQDIEFLKLPNAQVMIEVIPDRENDSPGITIDGTDKFTGTTNEKISYFPGDFHRPRISAFKHLLLKNGTVKGDFTFTNPGIKSLVRITLFFSISGRICIFDTKTVVIE